MKKNLKLLAVCLTTLSVAFGLASCGEQSSTPTDEPTSPVVDNVDTTKATATAQLNEALAAIDRNAYEEADLAVLDQIAQLGQLFIDNSTSSAAVNDNLATILAKLDEFVGTTKKLASGVYSFVASSYEERTAILAVLEKYAVENFLTGFSLIDDGGYSLYRPEVQRGVNNYITGYGWGTLSDGDITADLASESNPAWKRYYHTFLTEDPTQINYGDDKGSVVGNIVGYIASGYWGTRINETKDGYEWYGDLAKEMPQAVNASEQTGLATTYKWKLKTGNDGLKYNTLTDEAGLSDFAGRNVEAEDYLTPYKLLWTKKHNWARGGESLTGAGSVKGAEQYYNASADGYSAEAWENVGLKVSQEGGEWVMTCEFNQPCSSFYAMYYMASSIYSPVPMDFITTLGDGDITAGAALYQKTSLTKGLSPVDTSLSVGPYVLEAWNTDQEIVFKKNEYYVDEKEGRYKIQGIHYDILTAAAQDPEAGFNEFMNGNLHACGLPQTKVQEFKTLNDERGYAVYNPGESNFKLNVNTCTQTEWEKLFGVEGTVAPTQYADYWQCEPAMSNTNFLLGLSYAIDRTTFANNMGVGASIDYFGDGYLSDPENGVAYNDTEAHKNVTDMLTNGGANPDGYNLETAKAYFDKALAEMTADGTYSAGDTITIELAWQTTSQFTTYGDPIIAYFTAAFADAGEKYGITLKCENWAGASWSDVYYDKMMLGQYDIGFGSISGNTLNPLNFLEVLKSDNSSGFTLNWGCDTSEVNLEYDGQLWSFDALWQAGETGGYFSKGQYVKNHDAEMVGDFVKNADGTLTAVIDTNKLIGIEGVEVDVTKAVLNGYLTENQVYTEVECSFVEDNEGVITVTISAADYENFVVNNTYTLFGLGNYVMIDVYYNCNVAGVDVSTYDSLDLYLPDLG